MMKGRIFNIQRFCVHDGPGIRTTVFFKGCPLSCAWCHNPESQRARAEIFFSPEKCIGCGACVTACPKHLHAFSDTRHVYERAECDACGACAGVCPAGALEKCGREAEAGEILAQALRGADFYRSSGGGITLSGGEPMAQSEFALELARGAKAAGLHVCLETCGACPRAELERILPYVDLFLYDFKLADGEAHTGSVEFDPFLVGYDDFEDLIDEVDEVGQGTDTLRIIAVEGIQMSDDAVVFVGIDGP